MRLGILTSGHVPDELIADFGAYPEIFSRAFAAADPSVELVGYAVVDGEFPSGPEVCDAWLVTGSRHGVYDDLPFIEPLCAFIRQIAAARVPLIGVCFGHQIMAQALGGKADKWAGGWGLGAHEYEVTARPAWMADLGDSFCIHAMHQDQVTQLPPDAQVFARSEFCEFAALAYGGLDRPYAISVQPHPEFSTDLARALVEVRRSVLPEAVADDALESFGTSVHNQDWVRWFLSFIRQAQQRRQETDLQGAEPAP